jgi:hypothetical protein
VRRLEIAHKPIESLNKRRIDMKRILIALAATIAVTGGALLSPARAVPPTVTPSPGYDARLQESRSGGSATIIYTPAPRPKAKPKKKPHQ